MHRRVTVVLLILALAIVVPSADARQRDDWSNVERLKVGTAVRILMKSGGGIYGNFTGASDTSVEVGLLDGSGAGNVARDNVKSITRLYIDPPPGPDAQKWVLVGAGVGALTGAAVGGARDVSRGTNYDWAAGALGGALLGMMGSAVVFAGTAFVRTIRFKSEKVVYAAR
jgi:hypothetical protein